MVIIQGEKQDTREPVEIGMTNKNSSKNECNDKRQRSIRTHSSTN